MLYNPTMWSWFVRVIQQYFIGKIWRNDYQPIRIKLSVDSLGEYPLKRLEQADIEGSKPIKDWIEQFPSGKQSVAKSLLMRLRFVSRDCFSKWVRETLQSIPNNEVCALYAVRKIEGALSFWNDAGGVVGRPSESLGSEDFVYSLISSEVRKNKLYLDHPSLAELRKKKVHTIILIDDSIGSGDRTIGFLNLMMANKTFKSWWSFGFINFQILAFSRTYESGRKIIKSIKGSDHPLRKYRKSRKVHFKSLIVYKEKSFSGRWGDRYLDILNLCDREGSIPFILRRGFGDVMANIIFYHSVPDNIPGVLYDSTSGRWNPLFPERAVPGWLLKLLESSPEKPIGFTPPQISTEMIQMLSLVRRGNRKLSSIAHRMNYEQERIKEMLIIAIESGFITEKMNITEVGSSVLKQQVRNDPFFPRIDRAIYVPKSW